MKLAALLLSALWFPALARGEVLSSVELDLLVVRLPEMEALPMIPNLRDSKTSGAARESILKLIATKRATLVDWPIIETTSGQRAVAEHVHEVRYATEYEAPGKGVVTETTQAPAAALAPTPAEKEKSTRILRAATETDGIPAAFDTRNVGVTVEVEPVIADDGKTIQVNIVPQHIELAGFHKVEIVQKESGRTVVVEQPRFIVRKLTTSIPVQDGDTTLLYVGKLDQPKDQVELFILHTRLKRLLYDPPAKPPARNVPPADASQPLPQ